MGFQGDQQTRKLCREQHTSITRSRAPSLGRQITSLTIRHRLTAAVDMLDAHPAPGYIAIGGFLLVRKLTAAGTCGLERSPRKTPPEPETPQPPGWSDRAPRKAWTQCQQTAHRGSSTTCVNTHIAFTFDFFSSRGYHSQ